MKVAEPNIWKPRAVVVWEAANGPLPDDCGVHHKDEDTLNDDLQNLEKVTQAEHLDRHRAAYRPKIVANLVKARRQRRWSTRSATKRTGRHPAGCACAVHQR